MPNAITATSPIGSRNCCKIQPVRLGVSP
jgi:hypothetical protein